MLAYHRIPVADFVVVPQGRVVRRPKRLPFPLIVKSLPLVASIGISQASVVEDEDKLRERVRFIHDSIGTPALVEQYIDGRELYVGILGNQRLRVLPVWELDFARMPEESRRIATERLKWSLSYRTKHKIVSGPAELPEPLARRIAALCKRAYRSLMISGNARMDLRLGEDGRAWLLEANPRRGRGATGRQHEGESNRIDRRRAGGGAPPGAVSGAHRAPSADARDRRGRP